MDRIPAGAACREMAAGYYPFTRNDIERKSLVRENRGKALKSET